MDEKSRALAQLTFCHHDNQWLFVLKGAGAGGQGVHVCWTERHNTIDGPALLVWEELNIFVVFCVINFHELLRFLKMCYAN